MSAVEIIELWRGGIRESVHTGHAVICDHKGAIVEAWGDPNAVIFPRSSCKMVQALPLIESGAADAFGLAQAQLALACASHEGAAIHTEPVSRWLSDLGLGETDLRCGPQMPDDPDANKNLICSDTAPCQIHNNCSGKHLGFLTLNKHLNGGPEYIEPDHAVQRMVRDAFEDVTGRASPGFGIDGCSAPNFATTLHGLATAMAFFAGANPDGSRRERAASRLVRAMIAFPELVAGEGQPCTDFMRATGGAAAVKTGAEGVFTAIIPSRKLGIAIKITDGASRAANAAVGALLVHTGVLPAVHPVARHYLHGPIVNRRGIVTGEIRLSQQFVG